MKLAFLSGIYWLNFAILAGFGCVDFISVLYFYLFLALFVFPVGHSFYNLLFSNRLRFEPTFLIIPKILLAIPIIATINFLFGINFLSNGGLFLLSYTYILYSKRKLFGQGALTSKLSQALRQINIRDFKANQIFVILFSASFTIISINSFTIYNFFPDHVTVVPYPSDASQYYAIISSLVNHTGSFIHGYKISLFSGVNLSALSSLLEIFESVFIKFSGSDIVLFHSVNFSLFLILLLFCVSFLPIFKTDALLNVELNNSWNSIFLGLVIIALFSCPRADSSLLQYSIAAWRGYLSWIYVLVAIKIYISAETLLKKDINIQAHINLALLLCLVGLLLHVIYAGIFFLSFLIYLFYSRLTKSRKKYFITIWAFAIVASIALPATIFKNHPFVFGELSINIHNFHNNTADIRWYLNDLLHLKIIYNYISGFILSNSVMANITGSFYALFCLTGYFFIIPVYYFVLSKSKFKFYFLNIMLGIFIVLLLISYLISNRPSVLAMYMPNVALVAVALMAIEIVLAGHYFQFQRAHPLLKTIAILSLAIVVLCFNYSVFAVPRGKIDIGKNLFGVIEYVKKNTSPNAMILHNVKSSSHYAYFAGFAYRNVVMERNAYAYASIGNSNVNEIMGDVNKFYKDKDANIRLKILDKYAVTHILSSPECSLDLRGRNFEPVFANSEYKLYKYLR